MSMTEMQALRRVMKYNSVVERTVKSLMSYSPKMTATNFAKECGMQLGHSYQLSKKF